MDKRFWEQSMCKDEPQPIRYDGAGALDLGPRDVMRDLENPDMLIPPDTDAGLIPNLKFSFSDAHMTLNHGSWSREVTIRELPIATTLAGVNMALTPGGVREMHWHSQTEWAYVLVALPAAICLPRVKIRFQSAHTVLCQYRFSQHDRRRRSN
jgi:oxalate decarboxylase